MNEQTLAHTPLHPLHQQLGARMVPFAGYSMPVQYPAGIMQEHLHCRAAAGLFDVSHMGQILLRGEHGARALESLVPVDIIDLPIGQQRYALFLDENGGIVDDLMVAKLDKDCLYLVVNAACKEQDLAHLRQHIGEQCEIHSQFAERALLALQGPQAVQVLARLAPQVKDMVFMQVERLNLLGADCIVSRSGYTGEDGFEISVPVADAQALARRLLDEPEVQPIGLGARDSLRLEAGLCLYGHDMSRATTPVEANLLWAISKSRRLDGLRAGNFPGAGRIFAQQREGVPRKRVGLLPQGRVPVREGAQIVDGAGQPIGQVCSGGFSPSLASPVAMGYLDSSQSALGNEVWALVRGKTVAMKVAKLPFVPQRYYRG